jgi:single-strand DNA-binding protein
MAKGFNRVILMGNLTRDPETRSTTTGQNVTSFSLAVNRSWRDQSCNQQEAVSYINCVAWGKPGEIIAQYMRKGRPLLVSGRLDQRSWDDKETGAKRSRVEVVVEDFNFIGGSADAQTSGQSNTVVTAPAASTGSKTERKDVVVDDVDDAPIDLSEIPF